MFEQLLRLNGADPPDQLTALRQALTEGKRYRDLLAHGVWGRNDAGTYFIQKTSGNWTLPQPEKGQKALKLSRKELPEGVPVTHEDFARIKRFFRNVIRLTQTFGLLAAQLLASQKKSDGPPIGDRPQDSPTTNTP